MIADRDEPFSVGQLVVAVVRFRQPSERDPDAQREAFELPDFRLVEELLFEREFLKPLEGDRIVVPRAARQPVEGWASRVPPDPLASGK